MTKDESQPVRINAETWRKVLIYVAIIATWFGVSRLFPVEAWMLDTVAWLEGLGNWGAILFVILYFPACLFMLPDILPNAAAGAIWGVGVGTVAVSFGRTLGSAATFLLTRKIAGRWIEKKMASDLKFAAIAKVVGKEGFRIVILLRLCPLFPVIMLNYGLGLTRVSLSAYVAGTFIGMMPRTLFVAYVGSGAHSLSDLVRGKGMALNGDPMLYWGGLALSLAVMLILAYKARQLLSEATHQESFRQQDHNDKMYFSKPSPDNEKI